MQSEYIFGRKFSLHDCRARIARHRICDPSQFCGSLGKTWDFNHATQIPLVSESPSRSTIWFRWRLCEKSKGYWCCELWQHLPRWSELHWSGSREVLGRVKGSRSEMAWGFWNDYLVFPATIQSGDQVAGFNLQVSASLREVHRMASRTTETAPFTGSFADERTNCGPNYWNLMFLDVHFRILLSCVAGRADGRTWNGS